MHNMIYKYLHVHYKHNIIELVDSSRNGPDLPFIYKNNSNSAQVRF